MANEIIKTKLHPDGNKSIDLYPETSPDQIVGLSQYITNEVIPQIPVPKDGVDGKDGADGKDGTEITSIQTTGYTVNGGETVTFIDVYTSKDDVPEENPLRFEVFAQNGKDGTSGSGDIDLTKVVIPLRNFTSLTNKHVDGINTITSENWSTFSDIHFNSFSSDTNTSYTFMFNSGAVCIGAVEDGEMTLINMYIPTRTIQLTPSTDTNGTLSDSQYNIITDPAYTNRILLNSELYYPEDIDHDSGYLTFTHVGHNSSDEFVIKCITITLFTKSWVLTEKSVGDTLYNTTLAISFANVSGVPQEYRQAVFYVDIVSRANFPNPTLIGYDLFEGIINTYGTGNSAIGYSINQTCVGKNLIGSTVILQKMHATSGQITLTLFNDYVPANGWAEFGITQSTFSDLISSIYITSKKI